MAWWWQGDVCTLSTRTIYMAADRSLSKIYHLLSQQFSSGSCVSVKALECAFVCVHVRLLQCYQIYTLTVLSVTNHYEGEIGVSQSNQDCRFSVSLFSSVFLRHTVWIEGILFMSVNLFMFDILGNKERDKVRNTIQSLHLTYKKKGKDKKTSKLLYLTDEYKKGFEFALYAYSKILTMYFQVYFCIKNWGIDMKCLYDILPISHYFPQEAKIKISENFCSHGIVTSRISVILLHCL